MIIDRRVNIGQTVVASLNAPSLFLIAKDLRRMQVWASVNEADIGRIRAGMPVRFTVDAYPGETFRGKVTQIRLNATMTQNVVTYTVVVTTDNSERQAAALSDGERAVRGRPTVGRAAGAQRGTAVEAAGVADRSGGRQRDSPAAPNSARAGPRPPLGSGVAAAWSGRWKSRSAPATAR